jgi:radical S-adenosyl methionine domain-containing protein 2
LIQKIHDHGYKLKINTVINRLNFGENMVEFLNDANASRWKVFQVLPIAGENDEHIGELTITDEQFDLFLKRHRQVEALIPETNIDMKGSYVMVDPAGRFFINSSGKHRYGPPVLEVGIKRGIESLNYDIVKFEKRGGVYDW